MGIWKPAARGPPRADQGCGAATHASQPAGRPAWLLPRRPLPPPPLPRQSPGSTVKILPYLQWGFAVRYILNTPAQLTLNFNPVTQFFPVQNCIQITDVVGAWVPEGLRVSITRRTADMQRPRRPAAGAFARASRSGVDQRRAPDRFVNIRF
jgi:hypothetical protein